MPDAGHDLTLQVIDLRFDRLVEGVADSARTADP
jgi:hypothetical protein